MIYVYEVDDNFGYDVKLEKAYSDNPIGRVRAKRKCDKLRAENKKLMYTVQYFISNKPPEEMEIVTGGTLGMEDEKLAELDAVRKEVEERLREY